MNSPYKYRLEKFKGKDSIIVIDRADTSDLRGKVANVEEDGCVIEQEGSSNNSALHIFVAYEDIRGVAHEEWDLANV